MGADMIIAAVAVRKENIDKINIEAGREFVRKMDVTKEFFDELVNNGVIWDEGEFFAGDEDTEDDDVLRVLREPDTKKDESDEVDLEKVRAWLLRAVDNFSESINSRYATTLSVRDLYVFIVGGLSWGDAPEGTDEVWVVDSVPGLLESMGYEQNWHEVEPSVSPEEEAAAISSIKESKLKGEA